MNRSIHEYFYFSKNAKYFQFCTELVWNHKTTRRNILLHFGQNGNGIGKKTTNIPFMILKQQRSFNQDYKHHWKKRKDTLVGLVTLNMKSYLHFRYLNNICINSLLAGDDVSLHHLNYGVIKVHILFTSSNNPWVPVNLFKLKLKIPPLYTST